MEFGCKFSIVWFYFSNLFFLLQFTPIYTNLHDSIFPWNQFTQSNTKLFSFFILSSQNQRYALFNQYLKKNRWNSNQKNQYTYPQSCWQFDSMPNVRIKTKCTLIASIRPKKVRSSKLKRKTEVEHKWSKKITPKFDKLRLKNEFDVVCLLLQVNKKIRLVQFTAHIVVIWVWFVCHFM